MTQQPAHSSSSRLDIAAHPRVPLGRLVTVEVRKMVDTRAGRWLLTAAGMVSLTGVLVLGLAGDERDREFGTFVAFTLVPQGFLLPILGILLVTQEWGHRTALVTFSQEPDRRRVIRAKAVSALLLGAATLVLALALATVATAAFAPDRGFDAVTPADYAELSFIQASAVLQGVALGMLLLASAPAVAAFFVIPLLFGVVHSVWAVSAETAAWVDLTAAQAPAFQPGGLAGEQWLQLLITTVLWVAVPFGAGVVRVLRAEIT